MIKTHKLERLLASEKSGEIRTDVTDGEFSKNPTVGERFNFYGEPLVEGSLCRQISTSPVQEVFEGGFITKSGSIYKLTELST